MKEVYLAFLLAWAAAASADAEQVAVPASTRLVELEAQASKSAGDVDAQLAYGRGLMEHLRFQDARAVAERAISAAPDDPRPWLLAARALMRLGQRGDASSRAKRALELGDDRGGAANLLEAIAAESRMRLADAPAGAAIGDSAVSRFFEACAAERWDIASELLAPQAGGRPSEAELAGARAFLAAIPGITYLDRELSPAGDGVVRLRILWQVEPAKIQVASLVAMPPAYLDLLPLAWLAPTLELEDLQVRNQVLARARGASWSEVTLVTIHEKDGHIDSVRVGGRELFGQSLPVVAAQAGPTEGSAGGAPMVDEESLRREMFRSRYGKQEKVTGEAYRYRQILLGLAIVAVMALLLVWIVRRETKKDR